MRGLILAMVGLIVGGIGAFGYSHYLGEGKQLADAQAALADAQAKLAKANSDARQATTENKALSDQVDQLSASKADLQKQLDAAKTAAAAPAPAPAQQNPGFSAMMKAGMEQQIATKLLMLKTRLHLTPEQEAAVKQALEEENKRGAEMVAKMMSGGKIDPQAMANMKGVTSLDQTLNQILTPDQQAAYTQMKTDQKNSAAEMMASVELNQLSPLLQLTDAQKDQVYNALAQATLQTQDPNWIKANANAGNPSAFMDAQAKAKEDALAKILTPDQLATYKQQEQSQLDMQKAMLQKMSSGGGMNVLVAPGVSGAAPVVAPAATPSPASQ